AASTLTNPSITAITHRPYLSFSGNSFTVTVPMECVTLFVILPASSAPAAPTGLSASPGDAKVTLSWNAAGGASSYKVYRATTSGSEVLLTSGVTGTTYTDTGLTNGTAYYYKVS